MSRLSGAVFSPDRRYRYVLWRAWNLSTRGRAFVVIGLNPSTADERTDDPTIRRCITFAKRHHCSRLVMLNLFAYRATDPRELKTQHRSGTDIVGLENDEALKDWMQNSESLLVAAWGRHGTIADRDVEVVGLARETNRTLMSFGANVNATPCHPLYIPSSTELTTYFRPENKPR